MDTVSIQAYWMLVTCMEVGKRTK